MKTKLTLSVNRATLTKARRKLRLRGRSISAEVDAMLARIAEEKEPVGKGWIEQFGDLEVPLDLDLAESDTPTGRQLRKTAAYKRRKATQDKGKA